MLPNKTVKGTAVCNLKSIFIYLFLFLVIHINGQFLQFLLIQHLQRCFVLWFLCFFSSSFLYQFVAHWSRVASSFCCRLNRLVLDDRSKILTTSGEKQDAQPGRQRRRPDRSTGLHRRVAPLDKGEPCLTARVDQVRISPSASY